MADRVVSYHQLKLVSEMEPAEAGKQAADDGLDHN